MTRRPSPWPAAHVTRFLLRLGDFLCVELAFVLFLYAGRFKDLPQFRVFPVDLTLFFLAMSLCLVGWGLLSGTLTPVPLKPPVLMVIFFSALAGVSLFWSSLDPINTDKVVRFLFLTSPGFIVACMLAQDPQRRVRLVRLMAWVSCAILLYYTWYRYVLGIDIGQVPTDPVQRGGEFVTNYAEFSEHAEILFILFLSLAVFGSRKQAIMAVIGLCAALFELISIGGRGSLTLAIFTIPLLAFGLVLRGRHAVVPLRRFAIMFAVLTAASAVVYFDMTGYSEQRAAEFHTLDRYHQDLSGEDTHSLDVRAQGRDFALSQWLRKPLFGWGIGEFRVQENDLKYPHNLLLEILMELGVLGAFFFLATAASAAWVCIQIARNPAANWAEVAIALLFVTDLIWHLTVQGYLADDRIFFCYMGMAIGYGAAGVKRSAYSQRSAIATTPAQIARDLL
jgi:O-antigen ligase